jgi:hypothetical protein
MTRYFDGSDDEEHVRHIGEAVDRKHIEEEREVWLVGEACKRSIVLECVYQNQDDTF